MLYVTDEERDAWHSGKQKNLILEFSNGVILTNDDIDSESMQFEQTINEEEQLMFGQVSSACLKVRVLGVTQKFKNLTVYAHMEMTSYEGVTYQKDIGHFKVVEDVATSDRLYRDLTCYDALYDILPFNYSEWYNALPFPLTMKQFRDAFFDHIGIVQQKELVLGVPRDVVLINDNMIIQRNFVDDELSGADILKYICEINGAFGQISFNGEFRYIFITINIEGLYPSNELYPMQEGLYPRDPETHTFSRDAYLDGSLRYAEYQCQQITSVQLRMTEGDIGVTVGTSGNLYIIENNPLLYGMTTEELTPIAENLLDLVRQVYYTPASFESPASLWFELGDAFKLITDRDAIIVCVLSRRMSGITRLMDTYECRGQEYYVENVNSTSHNILVLRQRTNELFRSVEETRISITEVRTDLNGAVQNLQSEIRQTSEQIQLTVAATQKEWDLTGIPYTVNYKGYGSAASAGYPASGNSGKYYLDQSTNKVYLSNGSTWVEQPLATVDYYGYNNDPSTVYPVDSNRGKYYLNQATGNLYYCDGNSWSVVKTCDTIQSAVQSQITQSANQIKLKVNQGKVISEINTEVNNKVGTITIKSNQISIESDYFVLNKNGQITKCTSANIGGFTIDATSFRSATSKASGVYLSPNTAVTRNITNFGNVACLFAIGSNFGVNSSGSVYMNGAFRSANNDGSCTINNGILDLSTTIDDHQMIHLYHGNLTLGIGSDDIYFERKGSGHVFLQQAWPDLLTVTKMLYPYRDSLKAVAKYWNDKGEWVPLH